MSDWLAYADVTRLTRSSVGCVVGALRAFASGQVKVMNQDDQDFAALRRLMVLKRYEQPPPGYFNTFSSQVVARIEARDGARDGVFQRLLWGAGWLRRLWDKLETEPITAKAFGAAVCALFVVGVVYAEKPERQPGLSGPITTASHHLRLGQSRPSSVPGPFDRYPQFSDPDVQGLPELTGSFITVSLPDAN